MLQTYARQPLHVAHLLGKALHQPKQHVLTLAVLSTINNACLLLLLLLLAIAMLSAVVIAVANTVATVIGIDMVLEPLLLCRPATGIATADIVCVHFAVSCTGIGHCWGSGTGLQQHFCDSAVPRKPEDPV